MAAQSHRSNGPGGRPYDGGAAGIGFAPWTASLPSLRRRNHRVSGTRVMKVSDSIRVRAGRKAIFLLVSLSALLLGASTEALAINCVADAGGTVDGFVNYPVPPPQINIDGNCRIQNYPASNPLTSNFSFDGTLRGVLVIFDNVIHTGSMSCNASHKNKIWFVNGASSDIKTSCQNLL